LTEPIPERLLLRLSERERWRAWLKNHYKAEDEIWLVYAKKHTGEPRITYIDAARSRPEEFNKRLENFIKKSEQNKLIDQGGVEKYY
jgi:hypothetical protein